jgi:ATP-dependent RNA helicase DDX52/ROK1
MEDDAFRVLRKGTSLPSRSNKASAMVGEWGGRVRLAGCSRPRSAAASSSSAAGPASLDFFGTDQPALAATAEPVRRPAKRPREERPAEPHPEVPAKRPVETPEARLSLFATSTAVPSSVLSSALDGPAPDDAHASQMEELRQSVGLRVRGSHPPDPLPSFSDLAACKVVTCDAGPAPVRSILRSIEASSFKEPTAVQMQAIPTILTGRDMLATAPTGSGKTASYMIPLVLMLRQHVVGGPRAIVLAPTRELVQQITREGSRLALGTGVRVSELTKAAAFGAYGSLKAAKGSADPAPLEEEADNDSASSSSDESKAKPDEPVQPRALDKRAVPLTDVLVTTPQRLAWLVEGRRDALASARIVIIDEADRMLSRSSRSVLMAVESVLSAVPKGSQTCLLSATTHSGIDELASSILTDPIQVSVGHPMSASANVDQQLIFVGREAGKLLELRQMVAKGFDPPALVFVQDQERAEDAFHELSLDGVLVERVHAGRTPDQREDAVRKFRRGEVLMLIATEVLGRGMDFKAVKTVVNLDIPLSAAEYIHRVGRTGRAGRRGLAITFFTESDFPLLRPIANVAKLSGATVPDWMLSLSKPSRARARSMKHKTPQRQAISKARDSERYKERARVREHIARRKQHSSS